MAFMAISMRWRPYDEDRWPALSTKSSHAFSCSRRRHLKACQTIGWNQ